MVLSMVLRETCREPVGRGRRKGGGGRKQEGKQEENRGENRETRVREEGDREERQTLTTRDGSDSIRAERRNYQLLKASSQSGLR